MKDNKLRKKLMCTKGRPTCCRKIVTELFVNHAFQVSITSSAFDEGVEIEYVWYKILIVVKKATGK